MSLKDRLKSESFRNDVRTCFSFLGIENKMSNLKQYDHMFNWTLLAKNVRNGVGLDMVCDICGNEDNFIVTIELTGKKCCSVCHVKICGQ